MATSVTTNEGRGPLEHAIQKHLEEYYHPKQADWLYKDGIEIAGFSKDEKTTPENTGQDQPTR